MSEWILLTEADGIEPAIRANAARMMAQRCSTSRNALIRNEHRAIARVLESEWPPKLRELRGLTSLCLWLPGRMDMNSVLLTRCPTYEGGAPRFPPRISRLIASVATWDDVVIRRLDVSDLIRDIQHLEATLDLQLAPDVALAEETLVRKEKVNDPWDPDPEPALRGLLSALKFVAEQAIPGAYDVLVQAVGTSAVVFGFDYENLEMAARTGSWDRINQRVEAYADKCDMLVSRSVEQVDWTAPSLRLEALLEGSPPSGTVELNGDEEHLGRYVALRLGLRFAPAASEPDASIRFLTRPQIALLQSVLSEVAEGRLDAGALDKLDTEFEGSEDRASTVLGRFAGNAKNEKTRKRMKIETLAAQAASGKKKLLFVHQEE